MNDKELVGQYAAKLARNGMIIGLGTGSTADFFIAELARRKSEEGLQITCVASSVVSMLKAQELGYENINLTSSPSRIAANALYIKLGFELRDTNVYRKILE